MRFAGDLALTALMGSGGAVLADQLAHDEMDRMAQGARDFNAVLDSAPQEVSAAYMSVFGQGPMSNMDRILATGILMGDVPPPVGGGPAKADSPAGKKAIELASKIREAQPALGAAIGVIADRENDLFAKEALAGVGSADVMNAVAQGAGVSPIPAVLGALAAGGGMAALAALSRRRGGGDPFQVKRSQ